MVTILDQQSKLVEGSAACAFACASEMAAAGELHGKHVVVLACGGNVALEKLQQAMRLVGAL